MPLGGTRHRSIPTCEPSPSTASISHGLAQLVLPLSLLGSAGLLLVSLHSDRMEWFVLCLALSLPIWGVLGLGVAIAIAVWMHRIRRSRPDLVLKLLRRMAIAAVVVGASATLVSFRVPRRATFRFVRPAFEEALDEVRTEAFELRSFSERIGPWQVDTIAKDQGGGVYFRTGVGGFLDPVSYGFVHAPRPEGPYRATPFGFASFEHLTGDWFEFVAEED